MAAARTSRRAKRFGPAELKQKRCHHKPFVRAGKSFLRHRAVSRRYKASVCDDDKCFAVPRGIRPQDSKSQCRRRNLRRAFLSVFPGLPVAPDQLRAILSADVNRLRAYGLRSKSPAGEVAAKIFRPTPA